MSLVTGAEVTEVVRQLLSGGALGMDEILPELLKAIYAVELAWLTRFCIIAS